MEQIVTWIETISKSSMIKLPTFWGKSELQRTKNKAQRNKFSVDDWFLH